MKIFFGILFFLTFIGQVQANVVLVDESADGDLSNSFTTPTYLDSLTAESYFVSGTMNRNDVWDTFSYDIAEGYQLQSLFIRNYTNTSVDSYWSGLCIDDGAYTPDCLEYINFSQTNIGLDLLQFDSAPGPQGSGLYFTSLSYATSGTTDSDFAAYELELVVSAVPVPAAVWLFGSGLLGLVGLAKRKARS